MTRVRLLRLHARLTRMAEVRQRASGALQNYVLQAADRLLLQHELQAWSFEAAHSFFTKRRLRLIDAEGAAAGELQALFQHACSLMSSVTVSRHHAPALGKSGWLKLMKSAPGVVEEDAEV